MFSADERSTTLNATPLLVEVLSRLEELGLRSEDVAGPAEPGLGAVVRLTTTSGATRTYRVQTRPRLTPELATALHAHPDLPTLVVAPTISEPAAERLRARQLDYVDAAGNAHVAWGDVLVDVRGRRRPVARLARPSARGARAFSRAGLQVEFVLLTWPETAAQPLRQLARASGVSLGTAQMVVEELATAGHLHPGRAGRQLARGGELLDRWSEAYSISLDATLSLGEFVAEDLGWWEQAERELLQQEIQVGGEAGASLLDPHLRPSSLTLYVAELPLALIGRHRLARAEESGDVQFRRRFWQAPEPLSWVVPSTLVYADLLASGDPRQREHADRLRSHDDRLARLDRT